MVPSLSFVLVALACISAASCSSTSNARIIRRESGRLEAVARDEVPSKAVLTAMNLAQNYCSAKELEPIFPDEANLDPQEGIEERAERILKKLPGVGEVVSVDEGSQVFIPFRCG